MQRRRGIPEPERRKFSFPMYLGRTPLDEELFENYILLINDVRCASVHHYLRIHSEGTREREREREKFVLR